MTEGSNELAQKRMKALVARLLRDFEQNPAAWHRRLACVEMNLCVIRARLREFREWNESPAVVEALQWMDEAITWAQTYTKADAVCHGWIGASGFGFQSRKALLTRYPRAIVDAVFEPDHRAVLQGDRCLAEFRPLFGLLQ